MRNRTTVPIALAGAMLLTSLALAPALAQKGPGDPEPPITLRLLIQDDRGRQSEQAALDLARLAGELTDGAITIVPTFGGGDVATAVIAGETELGMVPSRDWDAAGVTSLDVLEAPFLIDNDALALAVATSDIADRAMAGLDAVGVTGLAMWPEDLRHLFALNRSGVDFSTPASLANADVLVVAGQPGHDLITQLGGRIYEEGVSSGDLVGDRDVDADSGALEGMVTGLWGAGLPTQDVTVAGDLVVYSKYQMLVANTAALGGLTDHQRELLDRVVAAAQEAALGRQFAEAELAADRCAKGGTVVTIGADAVQAFRAAAQPLTDRLAADPVTGALMADVEALKQQTPTSPGAGTCDPVVVLPTPAPTGSTTSTPPSALDIDGVYRAEVSREELQAGGSPPEDAALFAGVITWTISDGRFSFTYQPGDPQLDTCEGRIAPSDAGYKLTWVDADACWGWDELRITAAADGLDVEFLTCGVNQGPGTCTGAVDRALFTRHWIRVADAPSSPGASAVYPVSDTTGYSGAMPPDGVYRADVTYEDLVARGSSPSWAGHNARVASWTFDQGSEMFSFEQPQTDCRGSLTSIDGRVVRQESDCGDSFEFVWRLENDGSVSVVLVGPPPGVTWTQRDFLDFRPLMERTWTRIADAPATSAVPPDGAFIGDRLPPTGTYRIEYSADEAISAGASRDFAAANAGVWTWTLGGATWSAEHRAETCNGTAQVRDGSVVFLTDFSNGCGMDYVLRWRDDGDGLTLQLVGFPGVSDPSDSQLVDERTLIEHTWTRVQ